MVAMAVAVMRMTMTMMTMMVVVAMVMVVVVVVVVVVMVVVKAEMVVMRNVQYHLLRKTTNWVRWEIAVSMWVPMTEGVETRVRVLKEPRHLLFRSFEDVGVA